MFGGTEDDGALFPTKQIFSSLDDKVSGKNCKHCKEHSCSKIISYVRICCFCCTRRRRYSFCTLCSNTPCASGKRCMDCLKTTQRNALPNRSQLSLFMLVLLYILLSSLDVILYTRLNKDILIFSFLIAQIIYPAAFCFLIWLWIVLSTVLKRCCLACFSVCWFIFLRCCVCLCCRNTVNFYRSNTGNNNNNDDNTFCCCATMDSPQFRSNDDCCHEPKRYNPLYPRVSHKIYIMIAGLDAISGLLVVFPTIYLPSPVLVILSQLGLPLLMVISYLYLGRRYTWTHIFSTLLVLMGVFLAVWPNYVENFSTSLPSIAPTVGIDAKFPRNSSNEKFSQNFSTPVSGDILSQRHSHLHLKHPLMFLWVAMVLISLLPSAFGFAYKEKYLKMHDLSGIKTVARVALYQLPISILIFPLVLLPVPSPAISIIPTDFGHYISDGFRCFASHQPLYFHHQTPTDYSKHFRANSYVSSSINHHQSISPLSPLSSSYLLPIKQGQNFTSNITTPMSHLPDLGAVHCQNAFILFTFFIFINVIVNILHMIILKKTTANLGWLLGILKLGITDIGFAIPFLAGSAYKTFKFYDIIAAIIVSLSVATYWSRLRPEDIAGSTDNNNNIGDQFVLLPRESNADHDGRDGCAVVDHDNDRVEQTSSSFTVDMLLKQRGTDL